MNVAVIPARGASKRIPGKNVREFAGRPMIAHSIAAALQSGLFARVIVSTDDEAIARVARAHGAEVPFMRPAKLSDDHATVTEVMGHAAQYLMDHEEVSAICCIYATAPFLRLDDLRQGLAVLQAGDLQYVFSATTYAFPILRSFTEKPEGGLEMFFPEHFLTRSQDLPEALHDAAQFYWGRPEAWSTGTTVFGSRSAVIRIPRWRVQDIDTEEDWARAESLARTMDGQ